MDGPQFFVRNRDQHVQIQLFAKFKILWKELRSHLIFFGLRGDESICLTDKGNARQLLDSNTYHQK